MRLKVKNLPASLPGPYALSEHKTASSPVHPCSIGTGGATPIWHRDH